MTFQDFDKLIQDVPHTVLKDWDIELPFGTNFQPIIAIAREQGLITWHVVVGIASDKNLLPMTNMYWDDKKGISCNEKVSIVSKTP